MFLVLVWAAIVIIATVWVALVRVYDRAFSAVMAFIVSAVIGAFFIFVIAGSILEDSGAGYTQETRIEQLDAQGVFYDGENYTFMVDGEVISAYDGHVTVIPDDRNQILVKEFTGGDWTVLAKDDEYVLYIPAGLLKTSESLPPVN